MKKVKFSQGICGRQENSREAENFLAWPKKQNMRKMIVIIKCVCYNESVKKTENV